MTLWGITMWVLYLTIAMAPTFAPVNQWDKFPTEKECKKELAKVIDHGVKDGVIVIGKCIKAVK